MMTKSSLRHVDTVVSEPDVLISDYGSRYSRLSTILTMPVVDQKSKER